MKKKIPDTINLIHISQCDKDEENWEAKIEYVQWRTPGVSDLVTTTLLDTRI